MKFAAYVVGATNKSFHSWVEAGRLSAVVLLLLLLLQAVVATRA